MRIRKRPAFQIMSVASQPFGKVQSPTLDLLAYESGIIHLVVTLGSTGIEQYGSSDNITFGILVDSLGVLQDTEVGSPGGFGPGRYAIQVTRPSPRYFKVQLDVLNTLTATVFFEGTKRSIP